MDSLTIKDSEEMDLFGYMKTAKNDGSAIRSASVRLSNAISLEDYKSDMEFLNNKGLADRIGEFPNNPFLLFIFYILLFYNLIFFFLYKLE